MIFDGDSETHVSSIHWFCLLFVCHFATLCACRKSELYFNLQVNGKRNLLRREQWAAAEFTNFEPLMMSESENNQT
jgi:hypothetical protein